jgi:SAM-dependent methyltransferase
MGFQATGTDFAEGLLDIARKESLDIAFVLADMRHLPFEDNSFDAVWASAVLHHVSKAEMAGVLKQFWRVLKDDGIVYIHTKTGQGILRTQEAIVRSKRREFELITPEEFDTMLAQAGFTKLSLEVKASHSRKDLFWVNAFYRKTQ